MFGRKQKRIEKLEQSIRYENQAYAVCRRSLLIEIERREYNERGAEATAKDIAFQLDKLSRFLRGEKVETFEQMVKRTRPDRPAFPTDAGAPGGY